MRPDLRLVPTDPGSPVDVDDALPRPRDALEVAVRPVGDGTAPDADECLPCYVGRMIERHGCDGSLRWALVWRDARAPRALELDRRLGDRGGYCDCEVLLNVYAGHEPGRSGCAGRVGGEAMTPCCPPRISWW